VKRRVLFIPLEEIEAHLAENSRQDVKLVVSEIMTDELAARLKARGKVVKQERALGEPFWKHSAATDPNFVCEARDLVDILLPQYANGPLTVALANERAEQDRHYHGRHWELYFSEHPIHARYRFLGDSEDQPPAELDKGGLALFGPEVIHEVKLGGLTLVIEVPAVARDRYKP